MANPHHAGVKVDATAERYLPSPPSVAPPFAGQRVVHRDSHEHVLAA